MNIGIFKVAKFLARKKLLMVKWAFKRKLTFNLEIN